MSGWKDDDEVTTTYGSIQLSLEQAHAAGVKTERERIIKLLEQQIKDSSLPVDKCMPSYHPIIGLCCCRLIALIKGENK